MDLQLQGKNVLLFGGQSYLGRAVTRQFAAEGAGVTLACRDMVSGKEIADECLKLGAPWAEVISCDAVSYEETAAAADYVLKHGALDVVYHGIGYDLLGNFWELGRDQWDKIYEINFKSVMNAWHYMLPIMEKQKHGCFVNMASVMGREHSQHELVYGAMKAALIHLCQTLAIAVGPNGVRMNMIAPGPSNPPADTSELSAGSNYHAFFKTASTLGKIEEELVASNPLQKMGMPMDNAYAAVFLASEVAAGHLTGQVIGTDGGAHMAK